MKNNIVESADGQLSLIRYTYPFQPPHLSSLQPMINAKPLSVWTIEKKVAFDRWKLWLDVRPKANWMPQGKKEVPGSSTVE